MSTILVADPHLKLPRSYQWNVALEQSIGSSQSLSSNVHRRHRARLASRDQSLFNVNPNFQSVSSDRQFRDVGLPCSSTQVPAAFVARPAGIGIVYVLPLDRYCLDRCICHLPQHAGSIANPNIDRGNSDFDIRHSSPPGVTYDLPSPGSDKVVAAILGGWSLDGFVLGPIGSAR